MHAPKNRNNKKDFSALLFGGKGDTTSTAVGHGKALSGEETFSGPTLSHTATLGCWEDLTNCCFPFFSETWSRVEVEGFFVLQKSHGKRNCNIFNFVQKTYLYCGTSQSFNFIVLENRIFIDTRFGANK